MISDALITGFRDGFTLAQMFVGVGLLLWIVRRGISKASS